MFGPAVGNVVARLATGEGRADLMLRPNVGSHLRTYAAMWFAPVLLTVLGAGVFFAVFPDTVDLSMRGYADSLAAAGAVDADPTTLVLVQVAAALTVAPLVNALFAFGEEFGWRGYLLPKLLPLGTRRAVLLQGVVWGVWHWPLIAMGYEYGFDYPEFPWTGFLVFLAFTVSVGVLLAWATLREGSVWSAAVGHGAVNAVAGVPVFFLAGNPNPLLGPLPVGLLAALPFVAVAAWLLFRSPTLSDGTLTEDVDSSTKPGPDAP
jgi:membrane protease YdiL (CAAX protease family)